MTAGAGWGRRHLSAILGAVAAVAIAVAVYGRGCSSESDGPEASARQFLAASRAGDPAAMVALVSSRSRADLERSARRATELVGGSRRYRPEDMLRPAPGAPGDPLPELQVRSRAGDRVIFEVEGRPLVVVREDGDWRVELTVAAPDATATPEPR